MQLRHVHEDLIERHEALRSERELLQGTREELESRLDRLNLNEEELRHLVRGQQDNIRSLETQLETSKMAFQDARRKIENLEEQLQISEDRKRSLERLHHDAVAELKRTQMEFSRSSRTGVENDHRSQQTIRGLEAKVRGGDGGGDGLRNWPRQPTAPKFCVKIKLDASLMFLGKSRETKQQKTKSIF